MLRSAGLLFGARVALPLSALLATLLPAQPVRACVDVAPPPALIGFPGEGDVGVPTDVVPVFDRLQAGYGDVFSGESAPAFELIAESGLSVPVSFRRSHAWHFELRPGSPLKPNTRYTIRAQFPYPNQSSAPITVSLSFTTGAGPLAGAPARPEAKLEHVLTPDAVCATSCDCPRKARSCLTLPTGVFTEAAYSWSQDFSVFDLPDEDLRPGSRPYLLDGPSTDNLTGIDQGTGHRCVRLRTRGANGGYSEPLILCREDGSQRTVPGDIRIGCTAQGAVVKSKPIDPVDPVDPAAIAPTPPPASGCATVSAGARDASIPWIGLLLLLAPGLRCRSRR